MKIVAIVVTYNRCALLKVCIAALKNQSHKLDCIMVINNSSTDETEEWLKTQTDLLTIKQINSGGSGGFYRGLKKAYELGFNWMWCMDDDVYPEPDCLEKLLEYKVDNIGIMCPKRVQNGKPFLTESKFLHLSNPFKPLHERLEIEDLCCESLDIVGMAFEGPLINRECVSRIGLANKELFILFDDTDYSFRCVLAGMKVMYVTKAILNKHLLMNSLSPIERVKNSKWKYCYQIRNETYFSHKYGTNFTVKYVRPFLLLLKSYFYILKNVPFNDKYLFSDFILFAKMYIRGVKHQLGKM